MRSCGSTRSRAIPTTSRSRAARRQLCRPSTVFCGHRTARAERGSRRCSATSRGGMQREGHPGRHRALAGARREGRDRDRRRVASVGAAADRLAARGLGERRDRGLGLRRVRRVGRLPERAGGDPLGRAEAPELRDHGRPRVVGRPALRRRDRRLRRAARGRVVALLSRLLKALRDEERVVVLTVVEGEGVGRKLLVTEAGERVGEGPDEAVEHVDELIRRGRNQMLDLADGTRVFAEVYAPPPRLLVIGAVDTAEALCRAAKLLGWHTIVADARAKFATRERIPSADELIVAWPQEAIAQVAPDHATAVVVLTHDDKFDVPALKETLKTEAFYVGALGSRRNQEKRRDRLLEAGVDEAELERISGPCGLDVGADTQPETAVSILGEIL